MSGKLSAPRNPASLLIPLVLAVTIGALGCSHKQVSRIDPSAVTDLSGRWNDTDSRLVANALITQALEAPWARAYARTHGGDPPAVLVGDFRNRSYEHIAVGTFVNDLERAFINSGMVQIVAGGEVREALRAEREDQQTNARAGSRARMAFELGANYMLHGEIQAIEDEEDGEKIVYYQVDARMIDLESNVAVWAGQKQIKKYIERNAFGF